MASKYWVNKIMMSLRTTFRISDSDSTADDYELMLVKLTDAQCSEIHDWLITTPMEFAPKPGTLYARAKGNQRQTVTGDYLMDLYSDAQGKPCVTAMLDDKGHIKPILKGEPRTWVACTEQARVNFFKTIRNLPNSPGGALAKQAAGKIESQQGEPDALPETEKGLLD